MRAAARHERSMGQINSKRSARLAWALLLATYVGPILKWSERIVGWGGSVDFIIVRSQDPDWVGVVLTTVLSPPEIVQLLATIAAIFFLLRNQEAKFDGKLSLAQASVGKNPDMEPLDQQLDRGQAHDNDVQVLAIFVYERTFYFNPDPSRRTVTFHLQAINVGDDPVEILAPIGGVIAYKGRNLEGSRLDFNILPLSLEELSNVVRGGWIPFNGILHFQTGSGQMERLLEWFDEGDVSFDTSTLIINARSLITGNVLALDIQGHQLLQKRRDLKTMPVVTGTGAVHLS